MKKFLIITISFMMLPVAVQADEDHAVAPTKAQERKYERREADMQVLDLNKDGILQASELQKSVDQKFKNADINKDGVVSPAEREAALGAFQKRANDEYKTQIERKAQKLENRYDDADANRDGTVSKEEYKIYFGNRYQNYDRDGDGVITEKEYRTDVERLPQSYFREDHNNPQ